MINLLIFEPYSSEIYGTQKYTTHIFHFSDKRIMNPILVTPSDGQLPQKVKEMGYEAIEIPTPSMLKLYGGALLNKDVMKKIITGFLLVYFNLRLAKLIKERKIDIIHCNNLRGVLLAGLAARLTNTPCIWFVKGELTNPLLDKIGFFLAAKILFLAEGLKQKKYKRMINMYSNKISNIQIGIDLTQIEELNLDEQNKVRQELKIRKDKINLVFVGYVDPSKGIHFLIEAFKNIKADFSDIFLYIIGDSPNISYQNILADMISSYNIEDDVLFTGWREDVLMIVANMDIFVLPSLSEGVPRSIVEAMALGKPIVATKTGGVQETVFDGETGFVIEPGNTKELETALLKLIRNKELRQCLGMKGKEIALREYNIESHMRKLEFQYLQLYGKRNIYG